jgi:hypothetical protein
LERFPAGKVTVLAQHIVIRETLVQHRVALAFGHSFKFVWFDVTQANVFHNLLLGS